MTDQAAARIELRPLPSMLDETWPAVRDSVSAARLSVTRWLHSASVGAPATGDIALALSEACTNAVEHGYPEAPPGSFRVVAGEEGAEIRVTVTDDGGGMVPRPDSPGLGLGLPIMASLASSLEVRPVSGGPGTVVSMLFAR